MEINSNAPVGTNVEIVKKEDRTKLSTEDFLKIMAAELKYQNASGDSGGSTDYMSQLTQYTMLDQLTTLTDSINQMNMLNQVSLIGKEVTIYGGEENIVGTVEKVKFQNLDVILEVNGQDYPIGLLLNVSNVTNESEATNEVEGYEL